MAVNSVLSFTLYCVVAVILVQSAGCFLFKKDSVCYGVVGCYSSLSPFKSPQRPISVIPSDPNQIRTNFILYTRKNRDKGQKLDARDFVNVKTRWNKYFKRRQTQLMVHGFIDDYRMTAWLTQMKNELLTNGDYNTIIVDWSHGNVPPYSQATANTRVVGAQMALLMKQLQSDFNMPASEFHVIGHSLGSHVAGYAGEKTPGLGRITGLDPAGPFFEGTDVVVRLDPSDAEFVDSIHSDGNDILTIGMGTLEPTSHMDFYPNEGHDQPGCKPDLIRKLWNFGLVKGTAETVACNHFRAIRFFMESINAKCPFWSFACDGVDDYRAKRCRSCSKPGSCASMGFNADKYKPPKGKFVKYYTSTAKAAPFCRYHVNIKVRLSFKGTEERGTAKVRLHGSKGTSGWLRLFTKAKNFVPGSAHTKIFSVPADFGTLRAVEFRWHHMASLTNPLKWNLFGWRKPKLYLEEIDVVREEQGKEDKFCARGYAVKNDSPYKLYKRC